ncbi:MAG: carbohydrate ABC transporter permease [Propionibacteriaceae bacterium]|nr:carbohydrate ABC transporter permease [Propionibacteriaceae bacterium]
MTTLTHAGRRRRGLGSTIAFHAVLSVICLLWISPIAFVALLSLRTFDDIALNGLGAFPASFTFAGFPEAFSSGGVGRGLWNSLIVTFFVVVITLALASMAAFALSRYRIPFRRTILLVMLAGNLLPPQILLIPVARIAQGLGIYDTLTAVIVVQIGFGLGFYTFVLYGFMRGLPKEVFEAALLDRCGPIQTYWRIVLPLCRPSLAALAALATTWVFNDLLWALTTLQSEAKFPITAALLNLQGAYASSWNLLAAAALMAAVPPALVFFAFQRQFVSGLLVGSNK